jgi:hypothetical protein
MGVIALNCWNPNNGYDGHFISDWKNIKYWIQTFDLRVMSDFPDFGTFFTQALHFSLT